MKLPRSGSTLIAVLKVVEVRWLVLEHSLAIYGGIVATLFFALGTVMDAVPIMYITIPILLPALKAAQVDLVHFNVITVAAMMVAQAGFERDARNVQSLGLTPRELQILEWIAEGLSNKEIGGRLDIGVGTVRTHISHIFEKLHVRCRSEAVARYFQDRAAGA